MNKKAHEYLIKKYGTYVSNLEWHLLSNKPTGNDLALIEKQLECFKEILADLKSVS